MQLALVGVHGVPYLPHLADVGSLCSTGLFRSTFGMPRRPRRLRHRVTQQHICFRLIALAITLQPFKYIGVQPHSYWLLGWPVIFADLGSAPVDNLGHFGEINVCVFLGCDVCDLSFLFFCELLHRLVSLDPLRSGLK